MKLTPCQRSDQAERSGELSQVFLRQSLIEKFQFLSEGFDDHQNALVPIKKKLT